MQAVSHPMKPAPTTTTRCRGGARPAGPRQSATRPQHVPAAAGAGDAQPPGRAARWPRPARRSETAPCRRPASPVSRRAAGRRRTSAPSRKSTCRDRAAPEGERRQHRLGVGQRSGRPAPPWTAAAGCRAGAARRRTTVTGPACPPRAQLLGGTQAAERAADDGDAIGCRHQSSTRMAWTGQTSAASSTSSRSPRPASASNSSLPVVVDRGTPRGRRSRTGRGPGTGVRSTVTFMEEVLRSWGGQEPGVKPRGRRIGPVLPESGSQVAPAAGRGSRIRRASSGSASLMSDRATK